MDLYEKVGELFRNKGALFLREEIDKGTFAYRRIQKSKYNDVATVNVSSLVSIVTYAYVGTFSNTQKTVTYYADKDFVYIDYEDRGDLCRLPGAIPTEFNLIPIEQNQITKDNTFFFQLLRW
jgi:hypothetical protein